MTTRHFPFAGRIARTLAVGLSALALTASAAPANAQLLGESVTGSFQFDFNPTNFFDPANGFVPGSTLNSAGTTVTIAEPAIEFGQDRADDDYFANFTATQLIVTHVSAEPGAVSAFTMTFSSSAFAGASFAEVSDDFTNGGVTGSLAGDTITVRWNGGIVGENTYTAVFNIAPAVSTTAPEPGTLGLLALGGLATVGGLTRRRREAGS